MKRISGAIAAMVISCACCFGAAQGTPTATDLGSLERVLETTYHLHGQRVPMMGLVNGFAHIVTKGGVSGMRVVTYENLPTGLDHRAMGELARKHLGTDWSLMVRQTATGDESRLERVERGADGAKPRGSEEVGRPARRVNAEGEIR
jgi:hypothetical protein